MTGLKEVFAYNFGTLPKFVFQDKDKNWRNFESEISNLDIGYHPLNFFKFVNENAKVRLSLLQYDVFVLYVLSNQKFHEYMRNEGSLDFFKKIEHIKQIKEIWGKLSNSETYSKLLNDYILIPKSKFRMEFEQKNQNSDVITYNAKYINSVTKLYNNLNANVKLPSDRLTFQNICAYFGVMTACINPRPEGNVMKSFYGKKLPKNDLLSYDYELLLKFRSLWMLGSMNDTFILKIKQTNECMVVFNVGQKISYPLFRIDQIFNIDECIRTINEIVAHNKRTKRLIFCGHSNGMASATLMSIIFMCFMDEQFKNYLIKEGKMYKEWWGYVESNVKKIPRKQPILVYGSGGFPVIFTKEEQFIVYYNAIGFNYFHLATGLINKKTVYVDNFMQPYNVENSPENWLFYIFGQVRSKLEIKLEKNLGKFCGTNVQIKLNNVTRKRRSSSIKRSRSESRVMKFRINPKVRTPSIKLRSYKRRHPSYKRKSDKNKAVGAKSFTFSSDENILQFKEQKWFPEDTLILHNFWVYRTMISPLICSSTQQKIKFTDL